VYLGQFMVTDVHCVKQTDFNLKPGKTGDLRAAFQYLKRPTGRMERGFLQGCVVIGQGGTALN